ncbi:MAG: NYN domain-containing protein [Chloroflexota bacterium]
MAESTEQNVALFIDWDNLAISTAADLGGATPDVKRIVHKAQEYGRIIIARAYAEWNTMSERLSVYRAGVEPVYAPTFRFETDPITQATRGKSLADPVMVTDCIDNLHILPQITTYVIVTGDKDLIPVVRLAQLRGRKVVVIGPDFVAAVLRDMADEFVSYRGLVGANGMELALAAPVPQRVREQVISPPRRQPSRPLSPTLRPISPALVPAPVRPTAPPTRPMAPLEEHVPEAEGELPDLPSVFASLVEILQQMAATGRTRVRATTLQDQLLVRVPGFSERRYGFSKFKDLLVAAERGGLVSVSAAGPVHWVSLPNLEEQTEAPAAAETEQRAHEAAEVASAPTAPTMDDAELAEKARDRRLAVVRFIDVLRRRSRWLTYTYVLTNVIGFIGRLVPASEAESEARTILNYLVSEGVLRIDKAPQEVDVGGIKHRVRMCHFVADQDLVREAVDLDISQFPEDLAADLTLPTEEEQPVETAQAVVGPEGAEQRLTPAGEPSLGLGDVTVSTETVEAGGNGRVPAPELPEVWEAEIPISDVPVAEPRVAEETAEEAGDERPSRSRRGRRRGRSAVARHASELAAEQEAGESEQSVAASAEESTPVVTGAVPRAEEPAAPTPKSTPEQAPESVTVPMIVPTVPTETALPAVVEPAALPERPAIEAVFVEARRILETLAGQGKARVTGSSLKLRLGKVFEGFDERKYGYGKFKDFLQAAAKKGYATLEMEGQVSWVRAPQPAAHESEASAIEGQAPEGNGEQAARPAADEPEATRLEGREEHGRG